MSKGGRPLKITEETIEHIIYAISLGLPFKMAAYYVEIDPCTIIDWRHKGDRDIEAGVNSLYSKFSKGIRRAKSLSMLERLKNLKKAEEEHWQVSAWFLEREYPEYFGRDIIVRELGELGESNKAKPSELNDNELDELILKIKNRIEDQRNQYTLKDEIKKIAQERVKLITPKKRERK